MSTSTSFGMGPEARILFGTDGNGGSFSGAGFVISKPLDMMKMNHFSMQLIAPATLAGSWKLEGSNDYARDTSNGQNVFGQTFRWADLSALLASAIPNASGSAVQNLMLQPDITAIRAIRITFTWISGTGVPEVWAFARGM